MHRFKCRFPQKTPPTGGCLVRYSTFKPSSHTKSFTNRTYTQCNKSKHITITLKYMCFSFSELTLEYNPYTQSYILNHISNAVYIVKYIPKHKHSITQYQHTDSGNHSTVVFILQLRYLTQ